MSHAVVKTPVASNMSNVKSQSALSVSGSPLVRAMHCTSCIHSQRVLMGSLCGNAGAVCFEFTMGDWSISGAEVDEHGGD